MNDHPPGSGESDSTRLARILLEFDDAWQRGQRPVIDDYLPAETAERVAVLAELAAIDLERRLKAGEPVGAEAYLNRYPELAADREFAQRLIATECAQRRRRGSRAGPDERGEEVLSTQDVIPRAAAPTPPAGDGQGPPVFPTIAGYEILGELGRGGMGIVYQTRQVRLNRLVALKMLRAGSTAGPEELARFRNEAEAVAQLHHPHIVQIYEVGGPDHQPYFAFEYMDGGSLAQQIQGSPQPPREAADLVAMLAQTVHFAHQHGIIHRDLKPANILLRRKSEIRNPQGGISDFGFRISDLEPKVTDFGLAKSLDAKQGQTRTGDLMGTPAYMAPEQAAGKAKAIGPATDVYALGAILYELLTGRSPFRGETTLETLDQVRSQEPVRPRRLRPMLPRDLETICLTCLAKEPRKRYGSAAALAEDLHRYLDGRPIQARSVRAWERGVKWARRRPALAALIAVILLAALGFTGGAVVYTTQLHSHADELRQALGEVRDRESRVRQFLYAADMREAFRFREGGDRQAVAELLERHQPGSSEDGDNRGFEWGYLQRVSREGDRVTLRGHLGEVLRVAFSPDGKLLASGGADGAVKLWDTQTWRVSATMRRHAEAVSGLAFSPDGTILAAAHSWWGQIDLWHLNERPELTQTLDRGRLPHGVLISRNGRWLVCGSTGASIRLWDFLSRQEKSSFRSGAVSTLACSPDGTWVATGYDGLPPSTEVSLWEVSSGKVRRRLPHRGPVRHVEFSHDGQRLGTTDQDVLRLWDPQTGQQVSALQPHFPLAVFAFSPDDRWVALVPSESETLVQLWEVATGALRGLAKGSRLSRHGAVAFSPDGRTLAVATHEGTIEVWYPDNRPDREYLRTALQPSGVAVYSPDGRTLAVPCRERTVTLVDTATCRVKAVLAGHNSEVHGVAFSPDGKTLATAGAGDAIIHLWDVSEGKERGRFTGVRGTVLALAFSPDGQRLAAGGDAVQLWDMATGAEKASLAGFAGLVRQLAFSPDGQTLAAGGEDPAVKFWNPTTGKETGLLKLPAPFSALAYAPDGRTLATASDQGVITLWDAATRKALVSVRKHLYARDNSSRVGSLAFAPDGKTLASGGDGVVNLWHCQGRTLTEPCHATIRFRNPVWGVAFAPDGKTLATSNHAGQVRLWDPNACEFRKPEGQEVSSVHSLAFSRDGQTLLTGSTVPCIMARLPSPILGMGVKDRWAIDRTDDSIRFWDVASKEQRATWPAEHVAGVQSTALALSPDGQILATGNSGGMVWLWDADSRQKRCLLLAGAKARKAGPAVAKIGQLSWLTYPDQKIKIHAIAFSPDSRLVAITCEDGGLTLWNLADGQLHRVLAEGLQDVGSVAFSSRGDLVASNHGNEVRLWDPETGQARTLGKHKDVVSCVAFSPDGHWLMSGAKDGGIKVWDMTTEREKTLLESHRAEVTSLAFSRDGKTVASGSTDGTVKLWHVATAQEFVTLDAQVGKVRCVAFSPDGLTLAAGGEYPNGNGQVCFWHAASRAPVREESAEKNP